MSQLKILHTLSAQEHTSLFNKQAMGKQRSRLLIPRRVAHVAVRLFPKGYIDTARVTATLLSRSSKPTSCYGSLLCKGEQSSSIHHGMIQSECDDIMLLSRWGSAVSQQEGHGFHLASLLRFLASLSHLNLFPCTKSRWLKFVPRLYST